MKKILVCAALVALTLVASAQFSNPGADIPAYHPGPATNVLPALMSGAQLTGPYFAHTYQVTAYKMAVKVAGVLYQEPCYCRCDREMGHKSLHSCFEVTHGAACSTCMREAVYSYQQTKKGKTPAQIRAGIERGDFQNVDLEAAAL